LKPTRLYTQAILTLQEKIKIKGIAHITGGSYEDKVARIIPNNLSAVIRKGSWPVPDIFLRIKQYGNIKDSEMYRVFNMGIGMVVTINPKDAIQAQKILNRQNLQSWIIGIIKKGKNRVELTDIKS
jgi:phosphoribosylformylglycinamidine cyclo-ligase